MHSTLAYRKKKEKRGEVTHPTIAQTNMYTVYVHVVHAVHVHECIHVLLGTVYVHAHFD